MKYLVLAPLGPLREFVVVSILQDVTLEHAQQKAKQIRELNKDKFKDFKVTLFGGDYYEVPT